MTVPGSGVRGNAGNGLDISSAFPIVRFYKFQAIQDIEWILAQTFLMGVEANSESDYFCFGFV